MGHICVQIIQKTVQKHHLIALLFIHNDSPATKIQVDQVNRCKTDNRLENLRWVTPSENRNNQKMYNRRPAEYLREFPELTIEIAEYGGYDFDDYHYDYGNNRIIKQQNSGKIKIIKPFMDGKNLKINFIDINRKTRKFHYNKLIRTIRGILQEQEDENQRDDDE